MEPRWTRHAEEKRLRFRIDDADVAAAIIGAFAVFEQRNAVRYHAIVEGRGIAVVIKRGRFPRG